MTLALRFGRGDAARCRFAISPLQETMSALLALKEPAHHGWYLPWLRDVRPVVARLDLGLLDAAAPSNGYGPDFLWPSPTGPLTTIDDDLAQVRATDPATVAAELAEHARRLDRQALRDDLRRVLTGDPVIARNTLVTQQRLAWQALVEPLWDRIRGLLDADITTRARQLADGGLVALFADLHRRATWKNEELRLTGFRNGTVDLRGRGLILVPTAFGWPNLGIGPPMTPPSLRPRWFTRCRARHGCGNRPRDRPPSRGSSAPTAHPCWRRPSSRVPPAAWPNESASRRQRSPSTSRCSATPVWSPLHAAVVKCSTARHRSPQHSSTAIRCE